MMNSAESNRSLPPRSFPVVRYAALLAAVFSAGLACIPEGMFFKLLTRNSGDSALLIAPWCPKLFAIAASAFFVGFLLACTMGSRVEGRFWQWVKRLDSTRIASPLESPSKRLTYRREMFFWFVACGVVVLLFDWPAIPWGYFESDDFDFLIADRTITFPDLLFANYNDHIFPLVRLEIRLVHWLFGTHAVLYNGLMLFSLVIMLTSACAFLIEAGVTRLATSIFLVLCISWTLWGEFTSGEYILQAYQPLITLALIAAWGVLRWQRTHQRRYGLVIGVSVGAACWMNISGFWVACAALVFLTMEFWFGDGETNKRFGFKRLAVPLTSILLPMIAALLFCAYAYMRPGSSGFLSSAGERSGIGSIALQWFYMITTGMLAIPFVVPHHLGDFRLLMPMMILSTLMISVATGVAWKKMSRPLRSRMVAVWLVISGVSLMVCLGRPGSGYGYVVPPKYLFLVHVWLCAIIAMLFDGLWLSVPTSRRVVALKFAGCGLFAIALAHFSASVLGGLGAPFFATTRWGEIREHLRERAALDEIRSIVFEPLNESTTKGAAITTLSVPDLPGSTLCNRYPALRFPWGHEPHMSNFMDVLTAHPQETEFVWPDRLGPHPMPTVVEDIRTHVSPAFMSRIRSDSKLRDLYFAPAVLMLTQDDAAVASEIAKLDQPRGEGELNYLEVSLEGSVPKVWEIAQVDSLQFDVDVNASDPSTSHRLNLHGTFPETGVRQLLLTFHSDLCREPTEHLVMLPRSGPIHGTINLLHLPGYALSQSIQRILIKKVPDTFFRGGL